MIAIYSRYVLQVYHPSVTDGEDGSCTVAVKTGKKEKEEIISFTLLSPVPHKQERLPGDQVPWTWKLEEREIPPEQRRHHCSGIEYVLVEPDAVTLAKFDMDFRIPLPVWKHAKNIIDKYLHKSCKRKKEARLKKNLPAKKKRIEAEKENGSTEAKVSLFIFSFMSRLSIYDRLFALRVCA